MSASPLFRGLRFLHIRFVNLRAPSEVNTRSVARVTALSLLLELFTVFIAPFLGPWAPFAPQAALADPRPARMKREQLVVDGDTRRYLLHVPRSYVPGERLPLVLVLHGGGSSGADMQKLSGMNLVSADERFFVAYPDARDNHWNDGRVPAQAAGSEPDDVRFITALISRISQEYAVDSERISLLGFSNGGMLAFRLACERSELFSAIATAAASMPRNLASVCVPSQPVSVLMFNGTEDPLVPWESAAQGGRTRLGLFLPVQETAVFWAKRGSCETTPRPQRESELDVRGAPRITSYRFDSCRRGISVLVYSIVGFGHRWPEPTVNRTLDLVLRRGIGTDARTGDVARLITKFLLTKKRTRDVGTN